MGAHVHINISFYTHLQSSPLTAITFCDTQQLETRDDSSTDIYVSITVFASVLFTYSV